MAPPYPSIQSFYSSSSPSKSTVQSTPSTSQLFPSSCPPEPGDGFTQEEVEAVLCPPSAQWTPSQEYEEADIGDLESCPKFVTFSGRVVNFYDMVKPSKRPLAAKGCLKLMVADDTGALTVRLWYADSKYQVHLGQIVTVWTVHVSHGEQASLAPTTAPLFTSIFPERERSCHIEIQDNGDDGTLYKKPFGCDDSEPLPGLMTVKNFTDGGYGVDDCKLLVCVKSIGARKKFTTKTGYSSELISIGVFDDTAEAVLTLCGAVCSSASFWQPSHTVLLITNPGWRLDRTLKLSMSANTRIDVDPNMSDARWLKTLAQRMMKREHVNPPFPVDIFDTEAAETAAIRILYNLADIDEFARANPKERFMGYISVLITELSFVINKKRSMLFSTECCGTPIYDNKLTATCRQCKKQVPLRINPKVIGPIIDETGHLASGKLIFSDTAWTQLLGRTPEQLLQDDVKTLEYLEQRMLFLRVTLGFAWCLEGSKPLKDEGEAVDLTPFEIKRKRVAVFEDREKLRKKAKAEAEMEKVTTKEDDKANEAVESDGVGEVGRLCIWSVKT